VPETARSAVGAMSHRGLLEKAQGGQMNPLPPGALKQPTDSGRNCFGSQSTMSGNSDDEGDRQEEHHVERQRADHRLAEADADVLRGDQQRQAVGRRDQAEHQRRDDHHAHVQRLDVADLGQLVDDRHEDDDRRHRVDEVADDDEQHDEQEHDHRPFGSGERGDVRGDDVGPAQVGDHPAERRGARHGRERQRIEQPGVHEVARQLAHVAAIERRDQHDQDVDGRPSSRPRSA
jgi:hypothetical protein